MKTLSVGLQSSSALAWGCESSASYTWYRSVPMICTSYCSGAGHSISTAIKAVIHVPQQSLSPKAPPRLFIWEGAVFLGTTLHGIGSNCAGTSLGQILSSWSVSLLGLFTFIINKQERDSKVEQKQSLPYLWTIHEIIATLPSLKAFWSYLIKNNYPNCSL